MRAIEAKLSDDHSSVTFTISTEADSLTIVLITTIFCLLVRVLLQLPKLTRAAELAAKGGALPMATGSGLKLATLTPAQRAELAAARTTFLAAGGVLDEHADAFLLRFLLVHDFSAAAAAPQLRATAAWRNETGAAQVLYPPRFADGGVTQADFLTSTSKEEVADIFRGAGFELTRAQVDDAFERAKSLDANGQVSVQSFRMALNGEA